MSIRHRLEAKLVLIRHYWKTFAYFWKNRDRLGGNLFTEEEAEYLPSTLSLQEKPVSRASRLAAGVLIAVVAALFIWAIFGRLDIVVIASGEIIPSGRTKTIASVEVASVKALYVQEGQTARKGDVLIELDPTAAATDQDKAAHNTEMAALQMARSEAMIAAGVTEYKQIASELDRAGVLSHSRARLLSTLAGYRNRLVHFYHEVTSEELYEICRDNLDDLLEMKNAFLKWVNNNPDQIDETL